MKEHELPPSVRNTLDHEHQLDEVEFEHQEIIQDGTIYSTRDAECLGWSTLDNSSNADLRGLYRKDDGSYFRYDIAKTYQTILPADEGWGHSSWPVFS